MKKVVFFILCLAIFASSCKKDDSSPTKKIQSVVYSGGGFSTYEYTSEGKVSKITSSSGYVTSYEYFGNLIHVLSAYTNSSSSSGNSTVLSLNDKGLVDTIGVSGEDLTTYEYDNSGYRTKEMIIDISSSSSSTVSTSTYTYENGNVKTKTYLSNYYYNGSSYSSTSYTIAYEYNNKENNFISGMDFNGKANKNLTAKETKTYAYTSLNTPSSSYSYTAITTYVYEYQDNYVTKQKMTTVTTPSSGSVSTSNSWFSYTYK